MRSGRTTLAALALLAACAPHDHPNRIQGAPPAFSATTQILGRNGELIGTAALTDGVEGTRVVARVEGMAPGTYGIHLHAVGRCDAPDFASAGGHFNPLGKAHGSMNPAGPHLGDLPNLVVAANGTGGIEATIAGLHLVSGAAPLLDADGAAIIVHAQADDNRTDPSGNSGARIACGILRHP